MRLRRETMGRSSSARSTLCARRERDDFAGSHRRTPVRDASRQEEEVRPSPTVGRRFELQAIDAKPKKSVPERELHERPTELFSIKAGEHTLRAFHEVMCRNNRFGAIFRDDRIDLPLKRWMAMDDDDEP